MIILVRHATSLHHSLPWNAVESKETLNWFSFFRNRLSLGFGCFSFFLPTLRHLSAGLPLDAESYERDDRHAAPPSEVVFGHVVLQQDIIDGVDGHLPSPFLL